MATRPRITDLTGFSAPKNRQCTRLKKLFEQPFVDIDRRIIAIFKGSSLLIDGMGLTR
jgi:hypothetical protein